MIILKLKTSPSRTCNLLWGDVFIFLNKNDGRLLFEKKWKKMENSNLDFQSNTQ